MGNSPRASYFPVQEREKDNQKNRRVFRPGKKLPSIIAVFLLLYLLISFITHFNKLYALQGDIKEIERQVEEIKIKNEELRKQLKQVQSDSYIEQVAREKLGLVKPGETRIVPVPRADGANN